MPRVPNLVACPLAFTGAEGPTARRIRGWRSFHDEFSRVFAFPEFYGRNMDAWIDCMSSLDEPDDGLTGIHVQPGKPLALVLGGAQSLKARHPAIYDAIVECAAFVNWRRVERGQPVLIALCYDA